MNAADRIVYGLLGEAMDDFVGAAFDQTWLAMYRRFVEFLQPSEEYSSARYRAAWLQLCEYENYYAYSLSIRFQSVIAGRESLEEAKSILELDLENGPWTRERNADIVRVWEAVTMDYLGRKK